MTARSKAELTTLLADNTSGAITPSVMRDMADSVYGENAYAGREFHFRDEWMLGVVMYYSLAGGQAVVIGNYSTEWTSNARIVPITGSGRLGLVSLQTGEAADGQCRVKTCAMGAFDSTKYSQISYEAVVAFDAVADVTNDYRAEIGLVGNAWGIPGVRGFGHFFRYERATGGAKWIAVNRNLDVETAVVLDGTTQGGIATVDGGTIHALTLPDGDFFRLKVIAYADADTGAGSYAEYYVNDVLCATITTNMVTHSLAGSVEILKTAGTTSRYLALDYTDLGYVMRTGQSRSP